MATNKIFPRGDKLSVTPTAFIGAGTYAANNDPVLFGTIPGVCIHDGEVLGSGVAGGETSGDKTIDFEGVFDLVVAGHDGAGNAAVAAGDSVYFDSADGELNVDSTNGVFYGTALEAVASGNTTTTIRVRVGY